MDPATLNVLISASAGLLGTGIGGFTTYLVGAGQHKRQVRKERQDANRDQEHNAAKECEVLCVQMADDMEKSRHASEENDDSTRVERVEATHRKLKAAALCLPTDLRRRVEKVASIARNADHISGGSPLYHHRHYHSPYTICWHARLEVRMVVAAFVKGEDPPRMSHTLVEYSIALDDLNADLEEYYSLYEEDDPQAHARRRVRDDFYKRHPQLRQNDRDDE